MKYLIPLLLLSGCSIMTVPVKRTFPDAPEVLMEKCIPLIPIQQDAKLSDVAKNVSYNYSLYHECSVKVDAWQEWYKSQKKVFDEVK
jgi:hypothetical protein